MRSKAFTLPGYLHDVCAAVVPMAAGSMFLSKLPLEKFGLEYIYPPASLAYPFDDSTADLLKKDVHAASLQLGKDACAYQNIFAPLLKDWP